MSNVATRADRDRRYNLSDKGRTRHTRYNDSAKGQARRWRYEVLHERERWYVQWRARAIAGTHAQAEKLADGPLGDSADLERARNFDLPDHREQFRDSDQKMRSLRMFWHRDLFPDYEPTPEELQECERATERLNHAAAAVRPSLRTALGDPLV